MGTTIKCFFRNDLDDCDKCEHKGFCNIYWYVQDLISERDLCPLDRTMEECPIEGRRIVGECVRGVKKVMRPPNL